MIGRFKNGGVLFMLFLFLSGTVSSQIDTVKFNKYYFKKYWTDAKAIAVSPIKWDGHDWTKFGAFVAVEGSLLFADQAVADFSSRTNQIQNPMYAETCWSILVLSIVFMLWQDYFLTEFWLKNPNM